MLVTGVQQSDSVIPIQVVDLFFGMYPIKENVGLETNGKINNPWNTC